MFSFSRQLISSSRTGSRSLARFVSSGTSIPSAPLYEGSPGNAVKLAKEVQGKAIVLGVPGAFSPACSASHVPGYIKQLPEFAKHGYQNLYVVAINDAFVTKAWGETLAPEGALNVRFLADPAGEFSLELGVLFDASKFFGNERSKRYALLVDGGKVTKSFVEPDSVSVDVSAAEKVLASL